MIWTDREWVGCERCSSVVDCHFYRRMDGGGVAATQTACVSFARCILAFGGASSQDPMMITSCSCYL